MGSTSLSRRLRSTKICKMSVVAFVVSVLAFLATICSSSMFLDAIDDTILHKINWAGPSPEDSLVS